MIDTIDTFYAQAAPQSGGGLAQFLPIILIFVVFYFFLIFPQARKRKKLQKKKEALKKGQTVILSGGIVAKFQSFKEEGKVAIVEVAKGVNIEIFSGGIVEVQVSNSFSNNSQKKNLKK